MTKDAETQQWDRTENFGKFLHLLWDLDLVQRFLPERQDVMVLLCMLRYSDFHTGECAIFIGKICDEAGVVHPTQVGRIQGKILAMGAFWRLEGKAGFKKVNEKWIARYYRCTGKQILDHAMSNGLIAEDQYRKMEIKHLEDEVAREAEEAHAAETDGEIGTGLEDIPEIVEELTGTGR